MAAIPLGYYIHHHGTGHMRRALQIIPNIPGRVVMFSSAEEPSELPLNAIYIQLPNDAIEDYQQLAGSSFMYTPYDPKILTRYQQLLAGITTYGIRCMYVDVSMEVAMFCKTLGLRVGHNLMQGIRNDHAHDVLYRLCDFYLADTTPQLDSTSVRNGPVKVEYVGCISRYKKIALVVSVDEIRNVVITLSPKSDVFPGKAIERTAEAYPDINWHVVGATPDLAKQPNIILHGIMPDPRELYIKADVIVGAGGHNTITEMASLGKRFLCIPEERPYEEQVVAANALALNNMAVYAETWPNDTQWPALFDALRNVDLQAFQSIIDDEAAEKAAAILAVHT